MLFQSILFPGAAQLQILHSRLPSLRQGKGGSLTSLNEDENAGSCLVLRGKDDYGDDTSHKR